MTCVVLPNAPTQNGYVVTQRDGRKQTAHRAAWEARYGPIPEGWVLRSAQPHSRACVVVEHWRCEPRNPPRTHCANGHAWEDLYVRSSDGRGYCKVCLKDRNKAYKRRQQAATKAPTAVKLGLLKDRVQARRHP